MVLILYIEDILLTGRKDGLVKNNKARANYALLHG